MTLGQWLRHGDRSATGRSQAKDLETAAGFKQVVIVA